MFVFPYDIRGYSVYHISASSRSHSPVYFHIIYGNYLPPHIVCLLLIKRADQRKTKLPDKAKNYLIMVQMYFKSICKSFFYSLFFQDKTVKYVQVVVFK